MNVRFSSSQVSRDRWLLSYADFMTLLCAFFTTLYAASLVDAARPELLAPKPPVSAETVPPVERAADEAAALRMRVEAALADELAAGYLQLVEDPRGLVIEIPEAGAFDSGRADLSDDAERMMGRVGEMLSTLPNGVRIEGHTDDTPIRTSTFASNWELSTARATRVVAFLITSAGVDAARLSAAGYAQFRPRGPNTSAAGRARNRRVDLVLLNAATAQAEEPRRPGPP